MAMLVYIPSSGILLVLSVMGICVYTARQYQSGHPEDVHAGKLRDVKGEKSVDKSMSQSDISLSVQILVITRFSLPLPSYSISFVG